ncbi:MAG: coproporphyrinogen-III oxidase family protein [Elusimicrobiota bacterium]
MNDEALLRESKVQLEALDAPSLRRLGLLPLDGSFFPAIYYPPLTKYPACDAKKLLEDIGSNAAVQAALYIHIPSCKTRCTYCHWVVTLGDSPADMDVYLDHLEKEMELWGRMLGRRLAPGSILIGGGTPSILPSAQMRRLMRAVTSRFDLSGCLQFSFEVEPTTVLGREGLEKLSILKDHGVDRISMGVQFLNDDVLKRMGRPHASADALAAVANVRRAGFESLSIDLIYGSPGSTPGNWLRTLRSAQAAGVDAYQLYRLRIEPHGDKKGAVHAQFQRVPDSFPALEQVYLMKELGVLFSEQNGYKENFRRIFSRSPRHISYYLRDYCCRLRDVVGMGISSWSNVQGRLALNTGHSLKRYYAAISAGRLAIDRGLRRTEEDEKRWAFVLPLKSYGVSKIRYREAVGAEADAVFGKKIKMMKATGLLEDDATRVALTRRGQFFADEVCMQFYEPKFLPFPQTAYSKGPLNPYR